MKRYESILVLFFALLIVAFCLFTYLPLVDGLVISLTDWNGFSFERPFVGLANYLHLVQDKHFSDTLLVTLKYVVLVSLGMVGFGYLLALCLQKVKHQTGILSMLFFPHLLMSVIACVLWEKIFNNMLPNLGKSLGLSWMSRNLLAQKSTAIYAVAMVDLWRLVPYAMLLFFTTVKSIPRELVEYARVEGANEPQVFWYVQLPQTLGTCGVVLTSGITHGLTSVDTILVMTGGGPARATETLYYVIYKNSFMKQRFGYGLAQGVVLAFIAIVVFVAIDLLMNRKRMDGVEST